MNRIYPPSFRLFPLIKIKDVPVEGNGLLKVVLRNLDGDIDASLEFMSPQI